MKKLLIPFLLFLSIFGVQAQAPQVVLYGFQQHISPGTQKAGEIDENGKFIKKKAPSDFRYLIYLASSAKTRLYPVQLWINGEAFSVNADAVTPAQLAQDAGLQDGEIKTRVYKAGETIWKLTPMPLIADKSGGKGKVLASNNALVVLYKTAGKLRYGVLKKFTPLSLNSLQ